MVVIVVLQPYDPLIRVDRVDDSDEEEEQAQERLHATEVEWRMIYTSDYKAVFVYPDVCICASSLKLFLKVNTWFPMTAWKATLWWLYILKEGVRLISNTDWLNDDQSDKITFLQGVEAIQGVRW